MADIFYLYSLDILVSASLLNVIHIILFRGGNYSDEEMCDLLERVFKEVPHENLNDSICVVARNRIRITQLPISRR